MSSRVQKGGLSFKPKVKARARASATPGPSHGSQQASSSTGTMPPPSEASVTLSRDEPGSDASEPAHSRSSSRVPVASGSNAVISTSSGLITPPATQPNAVPLVSLPESPSIDHMSTRSGHSLSAVSKEPDQQADIPTPALDPSLVSPSQPPVPTSAPHIAIPSLPPPPEMPMHSLMFASSHAPPGAPPIPYYPPYQAPPAFQWPQWYPHVLSSQQQPGSQPPNFPTSPYGHVGYPMHPGIMPPAVLPPPLPNTSTELPATAETYPPPPSGSPFPQELDVVPHDEGVSANPDQDQGQEQMAFAPQIDPSLLGSEPMQSNDASSMISAPTRLQLPPSLSPADLTSTSQSVDIVLLDPASLDGAEPAAPEPPSRHRPRRKKAVAAQAENTERSTSTSQPPTRLRRKTKAAIATINGESSITPKQRKPRAKKSKAVADEEGDYEGEGGEGGVAVEAGTEGAGASTSVKTKATAKKRKRAAKSPSATPGPKRKRQESVVVPYNVDADPGEEPDPTTLSMADLITDMPRGRVSSKAAEVINNHATWKAASKAKRAALRARVEAKKYGRTEDDEMENRNGNGGSNENGHGKAEEGAVKRSGSQAVNRAPSEEVVLNEKDDGPVAGPSHADIGMNMDDDDEDNAHEKDDDDFDYNQNLKTNKFTVQVRIGPNGETIVDEQSLFVDRNDEEDETAGYTHIEESDLTKFVNSMTHTKKTNGSRWSDEETEMFYDALRQFGENYELISLVLPGRDRKACRNKFKAEDKRSTKRITWCLANRIAYDMDTLSRLTGKDFSGPTPVIRASTPLMLVDDPATKENDPSGAVKSSTPAPSKSKRKKGKTAALAPDEEIVGSADTFVDMDDDA